MHNNLKSFVESRLEALGLGPVEAALRGGMERSFISDIMAGKKKAIQGANIGRLAHALDATPEDVMRSMGRAIAPTAEAPGSPAGLMPAGIAMPAREDMPRDVPVFGTAYGSVIRKVEGFSFNGEVVDYVRRPPAIVSGRDVYAIYVLGESMVPAFYPADLCFVHPHRPAVPGDCVVVQTKLHDDDPGQAYIKELVRRTGDRTILKQFNPPATIEIPNQFVASMHRVLRTKELFGI